MKTWTEQTLITETQIARVQPNECMDGVVLITSEREAEQKEIARLYLTKQEARDLAELLITQTERI